MAPEENYVPPIASAIEPTTTPPDATVQGPYYDPEPTGKPTAILRSDAPNMHYASLDQATCEAELTHRTIAFARGEPTTGVLAPIRLKGPLHGISIHSALAPAARDKSSMEIFDCRLVLALDDFTVLAAKRDIVEIIHFSAYRSQSSGGCTPKYTGKQHCAALAVDLGTFKRRDGTSLTVEHDFGGKIGLATCGPTAPPNPSELRTLVCDTASRGIFHVMLTPDYNAQHFNHIHVEITPDAEWMLIH